MICASGMLGVDFSIETDRYSSKGPRVKSGLADSTPSQQTSLISRFWHVRTHY